MISKCTQAKQSLTDSAITFSFNRVSDTKCILHNSNNILPTQKVIKYRCRINSFCINCCIIKWLLCCRTFFKTVNKKTSMGLILPSRNLCKTGCHCLFCSYKFQYEYCWENWRLWKGNWKINQIQRKKQ